MDVKGSLTKKLGPLPAWAWLLGLALGLYYFRKYKGQVSSVGATATTPDTTPTSRDPVVLQPGESVYDPNTGQLVGGSGDIGGSGSGSAGGSDVPGGGGNPADPGVADPGQVGGDTGGGDGQGTTPGSNTGSPMKPRKPKRTKLNTAAIGRVGTAALGAGKLTKSKPRSAAHQRGARQQKGGKSNLGLFANLTKGSRPRSNPKPAGGKGVRPTARGTRTRSGPTRPMMTRTQNQRPVAAATPRNRPAPTAAPRPSAVAHNPSRTVHTGGPAPVARPRPAPPPPRRRGR